MKIELARYADLSPSMVNWPVDWNGLSTWRLGSPKKLDVDWFVRNVSEITRGIERCVAAALQGSGRLGWGARSKMSPFTNLTPPARKLMAGLFPRELAEFLVACVKWELWLPTTMPNENGGLEPCGMPTCPGNLGPEWIRHFMSVLYDRDHFTGPKAQGGTEQTFYPFQNRDHIVHSILVMLLGEVILAAPVDIDARQAVAKALGKAPGAIPATTVRELVIQVYRTRHPNFKRRGISWDMWLRQLWPLISLWHDAGYDLATWQLITSREFSHSLTLRRFLESSDIAGRAFQELEPVLDGSLGYAALERLRCVAPELGGYERIWFTEGCDLQGNTRAWGRFHALLSASELLHLVVPTDGAERELLPHILNSVALHHEHYGDLATDDATVGELFVLNPILTVLQFADALGGFARGKILSSGGCQGPTSAVDDRDYEGDWRALETLVFGIDWSPDPVSIWRSDAGRPYFSRDDPADHLEVRIRALWGDYLASPGKEPRPHCMESCPLQRRTDACADP